MITLIRLSGLVAILAGILNILSALPDSMPQNALFWVRRIGDISALIALIGIYLYVRESLNIFLLAAFVVAIAGVVLLIFSFSYDQAIMVYAAGVILLAIALLRTDAFPWWVPALWILSPLMIIPGFLLPNQEFIFSLLAAIVFGLGFMGAGYQLLTVALLQ